MFISVLLLTGLFATGTPSATSKAICNATGVSKPLENLEEIIGRSQILYVYNEYFELPEPNCVDVETSVPYLLEVLSFEAVCGKLGDIKIKIKATTDPTPIFISQGNNKTYARGYCVTTEIKLTTVDGYFIWGIPKRDVSQLLGNAELSKEELQCVADKVDVLHGQGGSPICWKA